MEAVSGRSRVPNPPAMITALIEVTNDLLAEAEGGGHRSHAIKNNRTGRPRKEW